MLQHYIPRFYLKYFSSHSGKSIGLYNIKKGITVPNASLYPQGAQIDFYGKDGRIEEPLAKIEGSAARILNEILLSELLPAEKSTEFRALIIFVLFQHYRTLGQSGLMNEMSSKMMRNIIKTKAKLENKPEVVKAVDHFSVDVNRMANLQMAAEISGFCLDLSYGNWCQVFHYYFSLIFRKIR